MFDANQFLQDMHMQNHVAKQYWRHTK